MVQRLCSWLLFVLALREGNVLFVRKSYACALVGVVILEKASYYAREEKKKKAKKE